MKDLRIEIKFKNNALYKKMQEAGYKNPAQLWRAMKRQDSASNLGSLLNFKNSPIHERKTEGSLKVEGTNGEYYWRKLPIDLAEFLKCTPEELFPEKLREIKQNLYVLEIESQKIFKIFEEERLLPKNPEEIIGSLEKTNQITRALATLTPRQEIVLKERFGFNENEGKTYAEIGKRLNISRERVRQIEWKALRLLRYKADQKK
jgi:RNA polymerase sigma factor (sigma-70 family)